MVQGSENEQVPDPVIDRQSGPPGVVRFLALGLVMIALIGAFLIFGKQAGETAMLWMLGLLAMIGVFFLLATAIGMIGIVRRSAGEDLARLFFDGDRDAMMITDHKDRILYANRAMAEMSGQATGSDLRSVEALLARHEEASEIAYRLANRMTDEPLSEEFRLSRGLADDRQEPRWYRLSVRDVYAGTRKRPVFAWQISDITEERSEQEQFFQDLQHAIDYLDHAPAGFFSADQDGAVVYMNATLAEWLGLDLTAFSPRSINLRDWVAGDGMALIEGVRAEPGLKRTADIDLDLTGQGGRKIPVRLVHLVTAARDGAPGESRTIVLNRSGDADASHDLLASQLRFTRFFNNTPMAIAALDHDGTILRTNAPFIRLFAGLVDGGPSDRQKPFSTLAHERDRVVLVQRIEAALAGKADIQPLDTALPDDEERHIRVYLNGVSDSQNRPGEEAAIVYVVEITQQKALEASVAQTQKMQAVGQLAGGIAHDFNNVLTAIMMAADSLLATHRPSDSAFQDILSVKREANRAATLTRQLLAYSRRQTMRPQVLSLTDVLADLRMLLNRLVGPTARLTVDHGRDLWPVRTDLGQFEQVITNLAVNARDALGEGGSIEISTRNLPEEDSRTFAAQGLEPADYVLVSVADDGEGMPPDVLEKIFEPFFTTKDVGKGTGLGLSMVHGIINQTGGHIFAESEPDKGTIFRIFLPRHVAVPETETPVADHSALNPGQNLDADAASRPSVEAREIKAGANPPSEKKRDASVSASVLLVEDEDSVRMGAVRSLTQRGYKVHEASSGVEALEIFHELDGKIDIVVSDVVMPEMDGPTLLRELQAIQPDIKFIFVSGYAEEAFSKNLPPEADFTFLPKPFSLKQLAEAVNAIIGQ